MVSVLRTTDGRLSGRRHVTGRRMAGGPENTLLSFYVLRSRGVLDVLPFVQGGKVSPPGLSGLPAPSSLGLVPPSLSLSYPAAC